MPKESMSPKERWLAVLQHKLPDRVPLDFRATREVHAKLCRHLGCTLGEALERLHVDPMLHLQPTYVGPPLEPGYDLYGCRLQEVDYGTGVYAEVVSHPLAGYRTVDEIAAHYTWPTADGYDFSGIPGQLAGREQYPVSGGGSEPFLTYKSLRGMEQAYVDLYEHPEIVQYCLDQLFGFRYEYTRRIFEQVPYGTVQICGVAEDLGSQESLLISPAAIETFFLPRMKRMMDLAHQAGACVLFHSDGAVRPILPAFIEAGVDVLDPVQWRCAGMAREGLKRDFGAQLVFHGAMDNQYTLAFGSVEEVRQEVIDNIHILGAGGGYILGPCHNIQAVSPVENIVTMYETAYEYGWY
jgi:uroporphyrinogen decarboxylase